MCVAGLVANAIDAVSIDAAVACHEQASERPAPAAEPRRGAPARACRPAVCCVPISVIGAFLLATLRGLVVLKIFGIELRRCDRRQPNIWHTARNGSDLA
jgi:hypothetical protein